MHLINSLKKIILQFCLILIILSVCRLLFLIINLKYFPQHQNTNILYLFTVGARFDWATIIYYNIFYLLLSAVCDTQIVKSNLLYKAKEIIFVITNILIIIINIADIVYYRFIFQRSTFETLSLIHHSIPVIISSLLRFWPISLFAIIIIAIFIIVNKKIITDFNRKTQPQSSTSRSFFQYTLFILISIASARGINTFPLTPSSANLYVTNPLISIVDNSAFDVLFSFIKRNAEIPVPHFTSADSANVHTLKKVQNRFSGDSINKKNVIVFVLESFSKNYLVAGHKYKANTPFLDSIIQKSVVCDNAFANGVMSINGLNSIVGGIPPIAFQTLTNSPYQNTIKVRTGLILEKKGYSTQFFFGSNDDHYGFKRLVRQLGISNYYGKKEFGDNNQYDGVWGIYDMPFFEYAAGILKKEQRPFFSVLFNLSSHYPYLIPEPYRSTIPQGPLNSSQSISYVDKSIESFFNKIKNEDWFANTLFVFVADHWSHEDNSKGESGIERYRIPLFFYTPDGSLKPQRLNHVHDQLDIVPTIMDILHISEKEQYLGRSVFDTTTINHFSCSMLNYPDIIQLTTDSLTLQFDIRKDSAIGLFLYENDAEQKANLLPNPAYSSALKEMEILLKQYLLSYYYFIKNEP